jgi:hypothetical protein
VAGVAECSVLLVIPFHLWYTAPTGIFSRAGVERVLARGYDDRQHPTPGLLRRQPGQRDGWGTCVFCL